MLKISNNYEKSLILGLKYEKLQHVGCWNFKKSTKNNIL